MLKQFAKLSKLHKNDLRGIKALIDKSAQNDGFRIKLYWNIVQNRLTQELNDLFYYLDGNLAGYLALFTFEVDEAEISAVVHPKYRQQGVFNKLLAEAVLELQLRNIPKCLWVCPQGSAIDRQYVEALAGQYVFSQIEMVSARPPVFSGLAEVQMRLAGVADLPLLAKIGMISFQSSFSESLQRFTENMEEKNRKVWLISVSGHENIGKIHVRYDDNRTAFIHDLCILPEYRGRKYAAAMILQTMAMLRQEGQKMITLDVETDNEGALRLYQQCGFDTVSAHDFWRIPTKNMVSKLKLK